MATLDGMADPPATLADLTVHHLERYWFQRRAEIKQRLLHHEVWAVRSVLEQLPPGVIVEDVDAWLHRRLPAGEIPQPFLAIRIASSTRSWRQPGRKSRRSEPG